MSHVEEKTVNAAFKYLKEKLNKGRKGTAILYNSIELQDYWNLCANIKLEPHRFIFNFRSEMNQTKKNFKETKT